MADLASPLPPGVTADAMSAALDRLRRIVGNAWVFTGEQVNPYVDPYPVTGDASRFRPHAAVAPASTEDVQAIVKVAGEYGVPLWPVSRGKNSAYGGAAPVLSGPSCWTSTA
jgi:4-cresol dehydrogenase (hydroxylating)